MALPTSREETVTSAGIVKPATINTLQDCVIGHKKPALVRTFSPHIGMITSGTFTHGSSGAITSSAAASVRFCLPVETGDRITGLQVEVFGDGVVDATYELFASNSAGVVYLVAAATPDNNRPAAWGTLAPVIAPYVMPADKALILGFGINAANYSIGTMRLYYDRL